MSFDKVKAMRSAERYLSQGKIRAAVGEYKRIVDNDPKDYSTLNILGDLYVKNGENDDAVACYSKVAEHFSKQGFAQKAIAIFNKISRIKPDSLEVQAKLAKLYQMKGSFAEARTHYVALAEQYQKRGQKGEALEIWKQVAELDPYNTEVYLKIAETCWQEGNKDEAAKAFTEAGLRLARQNQLEAAMTAYSRALEIRPYELNALNGYITTQIKLGYAEEAAKHLEGILEKNPYNREILYLLVDCYIVSEKADDAEKAVVRLVEQEPANYPKFLDLVELYIKTGDLPSAVRILSMSSEHLLVGGKSDDFLKWTNEILARDPEQVDALRLLVRYYGWQRDETELRRALERLAETARLKESLEDESYALGQLVMIMPHDVNYARRLQELTHGSANVQPRFADESAYEFQDSNEEVPTFDNFQDLAAEPAPEINGFDFATYNGDVDLAGAPDAFVYTEPLDSGDGGPKTPEPASGVSSVMSALPLTASDELRIEQEIESIRFYFTQGYLELADKTLEGLEVEFGFRPEFAALRAEMSGNDETTATETVAAATIEAESVVEETPVTEALVADAATEQPAIADDFQCALPEESVASEPASEDTAPREFGFFDDFRNDLGLEESEPVDDGDYDTHYQMAIAYKEMGLMEESIREFQEAVNLVRVDDGTPRFFQCCNLLGLCFMEQGMPNLALLWYRRALETPGLTDDEKQALLYETAIAYEMGGEMPKAVEYYEQIYAVNVDYRDVSSRLEHLRESNFAM